MAEPNPQVRNGRDLPTMIGLVDAALAIADGLELDMIAMHLATALALAETLALPSVDGG